MFLARVRRFSLGASLLTPLVYWPQLYDPEFLQSAWLATWATLACAASLALPAPDDPARRRPLRLILLGWGLIAVMGVIDLPLVTDTFLWRRALLHIGTLLALTRAAGDEIAEARGADLWTRILCGAALAACVLGFVGVLAGDPRHWSMNGRWVGPFGNPNWAGAFTAGILPLALAAVIAAETRTAAWLAGSAAVGAAIGAAASGSRGAWLGAACGLVTTFFVALRSRGWASVRREGSRPLLVVAGAVLAILVGIECLQAPLPVDTSTRTLSIRTLIWSSTGRMILDHPTTGVGLGQFLARFPPYRSPIEHAASGELTHVGDPHNSALAVVAEGGWPAALGLALVLAGLIAAHRPLPRGSGLPWTLAGTAGALVAVGVAGCFTEIVQRPTLVPLLAFLGPLATGAHSQERAAPVRFGLPLVGTLVLIVGGVLTATAGWAPAGAAWELGQAVGDGAGLFASERWNQALRFAPDWPEVLAWEIGGWRRDLDGALRLRPYDPALINDRGLQNLGDPNVAKANFRQAVAIAPAFQRAWINLALILGKDGHVDEALDALATGILALDVAGNSSTNADNLKVGEVCLYAAYLATRLGRTDDTRKWLLAARRRGIDLHGWAQQVIHTWTGEPIHWQIDVSTISQRPEFKDLFER